MSGLLGVQSGCAINKIVQLPASNSCYNHRAAMRLFGRQQACVRVGMWRSLVARLLWEQDVAGSNPVVPTTFFVSLSLTQRRNAPMLRFRRAFGLRIQNLPSRTEVRSAVSGEFPAPVGTSLTSLGKPVLQIEWNKTKLLLYWFSFGSLRSASA